jgi:hypothetical protein
MAVREELNSITMEQALEPGTIVELEYKLLTDNTTLVGAWLSQMEPKLEKEAPLWHYLGFDMGLDGKTVTFKMELQNYVVNIDTGEIRAWDPATGGFTGTPKTKYYASAISLRGLVETAGLIAAGFTFVFFVQGWKISKETEQMEARAEIEQDPNLTEEQKARILGEKSSPWPATVGVTFASVALIVIVLFVWSWSRR